MVDYLIAMVMGVVLAFVGILLPGMLNMTAVSVSMKSGNRAALLFSGGMAITTALQAFLAISFADFLRRNAALLDNFRVYSILLFLLLAIYFGYKGAKPTVIQPKEISGRKHFGGGIFMAALNALAILYFFAMGTMLTARDLIQPGILSVVSFSVGAGIGAFLMFWLYVRAAGWISENAIWFTRNVNYIIGAFFVLLALVQLFNLPA